MPTPNLDFWEDSPSPSNTDPQFIPQYEEYKKQWYDAFGKNFHNQSFNTPEQYAQWVGTLPHASMEIKPFMVQIAKKYMPRNVRMQYEKAIAQREAQDNFQSQIEQQGIMQSKILDEVKKGNLPDGTGIDPKTGSLSITPYRVMGNEVEQVNQKQESQKFQQAMKYYAMLEKQYNRADDNGDMATKQRLEPEIRQYEQYLMSVMKQQIGGGQEQSQGQTQVANQVPAFASEQEAEMASRQGMIKSGQEVKIGNQLGIWR